MKTGLDIDTLLLSRILGLKTQMGLSQKAIHVLIIFMEYRVRWPEIEDKISIEYLADVLSYSEKTVYNAISELRKNEILRRTQATGQGGGHADIYLSDFNDSLLLLIEET